MNKEVLARVKHKRDTQINWENNNPTLLNGEIILVDTNEGKLQVKIGDGTNPYNVLPFYEETLRQVFIESIYPVGSIYISTNRVSPASFWGGTWEQIQDRFLLGAGSAYTAGSTGGKSTHTLTVQEMPVHSHTVNAHSHAIGLDNDTTVGTYGWSLHVNANGTSVTGAHKTVTSGTSSPNTNTIGGGVAHNNMPPYLAVYMWKRIA